METTLAEIVLIYLYDSTQWNDTDGDGFETTLQDFMLMNVSLISGLPF